MLGVFYTPGWAAVLTGGGLAAGGTLAGVTITQLFDRWGEAYRQAQSTLASAADAYATAQLELLDHERILGAALSGSCWTPAVEVHDVRKALDEYGRFDGATVLPPRFPRLRG